MDCTPTTASRTTEQTPFNPSESKNLRTADRWHVSLQTPLGIGSFLLLGIASALTHHFYYTSLDGRPVAETTQEWAVRVGTGLAVLAKACLIASAAMSYQQHYWRVLRTRPISIRGIDAMMNLLANPTCFFNWEIIRNAWTSAAIALAIWCIPLSTIIPPASLTAAISTFQESTIAQVPLVSWSAVQFSQTGGRNEFSDAGQPTYRVVTASAYSGSILPMTALHPNYTYTLDFLGPRLRCGDVKNYTLFNKANLTHQVALGEELFYNATTTRSVDHLFEFPTENLYDIWFSTPTRNFTCETWNVTYTADFSFVKGEQSIVVTNVRYDHRFAADDSGSGDLCPFDWCGYKGWYTAVASMVTGEAWTGGAYGTSKITTRAFQTALIGCPEMRPAAAMSRILGVQCPGPSLEWAVEALSENATLSFFGALPSVYTPEVKYDSHGIEANVTVANITTTPANLTIFTAQLVHTYNARPLVLSYSAAVFATIVILLAGICAIWSNGISHSSSFSGIVCTTRNKELDELAQGHCLGAEPIEKNIAKQKLQYGLLNFHSSNTGDMTSSVQHAAFGFPGSVVRLRKGNHYE